MHYVTFRNRGQLYCLKIQDVSEVLPDVPLLRLPRTPECFDGLFQLRGRPITVLNFLRALEIPAADPLFQLIVLAQPHHHFALRVPGVVETKIVASIEPDDASSFSLGIDGIEGEQRYHLLFVDKLMAFAKSLVSKSITASSSSETDESR